MTEQTTLKRCSRCKEDLPLSKFGKAKRTHDGLQTYCTSCFNDYSRERREKKGDHCRAVDRARYARQPEKEKARQQAFHQRHPERRAIVRRKQTLKAYGLTPADYDAMLESQDNACAICDSEDPKHWSGKFHVDHDHLTGVVRGLLCHNCNSLLGHSQDDTEILSAAIEYLDS